MLDLRCTERALLQLVIWGLDEEACYEANRWESLDDALWREVFLMSISQGVSTIAYDGVVKLPEIERPHYDVYLNWKLTIDEQLRLYEKHCKLVGKLSDFFQLHGIGMALLKGVGMSSLYPIPSHRKTGDIDLYTDSLDESVLSNKQANRRAEHLLFQQGALLLDKTDDNSIEAVMMFKGCKLENHRCFIAQGSSRFMQEVESELHRLLNPILLTLGDSTFKIPSEEFNRLYLPFHTAAHFSGRGLSIHHFCDWYCFVKRYGYRVPSLPFNLVYQDFVTAMTTFCVLYLGLKIDNFTITPSSRNLAERMLKETFHTPYLVKDSVFPMNLVYKVQHFFYSRKNANLSIGSSSFLGAFIGGIKANFREGRFFKAD